MKCLILLVILFILLPIAMAVECPFGEVDCSGECGNFIDENNNGLCDLSETESVIDVRKEDINNSDIKIGREYYFWQISLATIILYGITYFLSKKGKIALITHRKIWNIFLLISFLGVGILGVLLTIQLNYSLSSLIFINELFWHVEAGIVMTIISVFHAAWHFNYYKAMIKKKCEN